MHSAARVARAARSLRPRAFSSRAAVVRETEVLVVGCGIAGCAAATSLARQGRKVMLLSASQDPLDCNSYWAQGGIIYKSPDDTPEDLAEDIHTAGAGLCSDDAVMQLGRKGPKSVEELLLEIAKVPFDLAEDGSLALCLEGGHHKARIIHWGDSTGRAITEYLQRAVINMPEVQLVHSAPVVDLIMEDGVCVGAQILREGELEVVAAGETILATGGIGEVYAHTSNPPSANGDGIALGRRVGAELRGMEYVQFHPTTLYRPGHRSFLVSEAVRGEGARLINAAGERFAFDYHPMGELAPRDIVARMIRSEMALSGSPSVNLDISHRERPYLEKRFPAIFKQCLKAGFDLSQGGIPVTPAQHFSCGGISVDLTSQTSVRGLRAVGEVSSTGLHGGNRLASTSLLEGLVWGQSAAADIQSKDLATPVEKAKEAVSKHLTTNTGDAAADEEEVQALRRKMQQVMWDKVGIIRSTPDLEAAGAELAGLQAEAEGIYKSRKLTLSTMALRNGVATAQSIQEAAAANPVSKGAHFMQR
mmetsp:Transcript_30550/g.64825  ORF Transcript_30550/g.64825 Transcript_30550/m.64825 type:complete len:533 (+) Transcript_30550:1-1599(+)